MTISQPHDSHRSRISTGGFAGYTILDAENSLIPMAAGRPELVGAEVLQHLSVNKRLEARTVRLLLLWRSDGMR